MSSQHEAAAKAWLDQWVPGYSVGQWAALTELLASQRGEVPLGERESTPAPTRCGMYVYRIDAAGAENDGAALELYGANPVHAKSRAAEEAQRLGVRLAYVGIWRDPTSERHRRFELHMPYIDAPDWARRWVDAQAEALRTKKARKKQRAEDEADDEEAA